MIKPPPQIDARTASEIAEQVRGLLREYAPEWQPQDPLTGERDQLAAALIAIFARYSEIIIQRLNQAPQKNLLAFLDLLGAAPMPPQPARVPLTFIPAAGAVVDGVVPPGTQVASPPGEGEADPVIFETERELVVTAATLDALFVVEPDHDRYGDRRALLVVNDPDQRTLTVVNTEGQPLFEAETAIDHILYLGDRDFFSLSNLANVSLSMTFKKNVADEMVIHWERWDGTNWILMAKETTTANDPKQTVTFGALPVFPLSEVRGIESRWIRGRLLTPITPSTTAQPGRVRAQELPTLTRLELTGDIKNDELLPEQSFSNDFPLDTSKEILPFGEQPKLGDAWLIGQSEAFSQPGAKITLNLVFASPGGASDDLALVWETWNGKRWEPFETTPTEQPATGQVRDETNRLTKNGRVILRLPARIASKEINGVANWWLRVRVTKGTYGQGIRYDSKDFGNNVKGFVIAELPNYKPPIIKSVLISYEGSRAESPDISLAYNNVVYSPLLIANTPRITLPGDIFGGGTKVFDLRPGRDDPFEPVTNEPAGPLTRPALYLGFRVPAGRDFGQHPVSLYFRMRAPLYGESAAAVSVRPGLAWECWNGRSWEEVTVDDDTAALTRSGIVQFLPPADFTASWRFNELRYWLRARWKEGQYKFKPRGRLLLQSTTIAVQASTVRNEILGSSNSEKYQLLRAARAPILNGQQLEVREMELPSAAEQRTIKLEEGDDAITITPDSPGRPKEVWVRWHAVSDFYGSGPRDRHYVLDHLTGEIRFNDGVNGLIPPPGTKNVRLAYYRTGGGAAGNRAAGSIIQLKTTVPYVDKVTNHEAAAGGADAEAVDLLLDRAPRTIRHNNRAVTSEDYEDVGLLASPEVARVKCAPLRDLGNDPLDKGVTIDPLSRVRGVRGYVSVIIVPRSTAPKPLPSLELIDRVQEHLELHSPATAHVAVVGPLYLRVDVKAQIAIVRIEGAGSVEFAVRQQVAAFLHPLTGGLDGAGWDFGREPQRSDLYALIEAVPGVDHVRRLTLTVGVDASDIAALGLDANTAVDDIKRTRRFLVYSGAHEITTTFETD